MLTVVLDPIVSFSLSITYQASMQSETYYCNDCFWKLSWLSQNKAERTQIRVFLKITRESKHIPRIKSLRFSQKSAVIINIVLQPWLEQISFKACWDWLIMQIKFLPVKLIARIAFFFQQSKHLQGNKYYLCYLYPISGFRWRFLSVTSEWKANEPL